MPALAEYYAELGVHGMPRIMGAFAQVRSGLASLASAATSPIRGIGNMLAGLASPAGLASAALGAVGVAGMGGILKLASDVESLDTQFRVLLGSGEAARPGHRPRSAACGPMRRQSNAGSLPVIRGEAAMKSSICGPTTVSSAGPMSRNRVAAASAVAGSAKKASRSSTSWPWPPKVARGAISTHPKEAA